MTGIADYSFVSRWQLETSIQEAWEAIYNTEDWPRWWPYVLRVEELQHGDERGIGTLRRLTWKTALPYSLAFEMRTVRVEPPYTLEAQAKGELVGTGLWQLTSQNDLVHVQYDWNVRTTKRWMNLLAPLARPAFAWNHDVVMRAGAQGLARHLRARLVTAG